MVGKTTSDVETTPFHIALPERLDTAAAQSLHAELLAHANEDLHLDFASVTMLGGLCLQVLLNLRHHWEVSGHSVTLTNISPQISKALADFGTSPSALSTESFS